MRFSSVDLERLSAKQMSEISLSCTRERRLGRGWMVGREGSFIRKTSLTWAACSWWQRPFWGGVSWLPKYFDCSDTAETSWSLTLRFNLFSPGCFFSFLFFYIGLETDQISHFLIISQECFLSWFAFNNGEHFLKINFTWATWIGADPKGQMSWMSDQLLTQTFHTKNKNPTKVDQLLWWNRLDNPEPRDESPRGKVTTLWRVE